MKVDTMRFVDRYAGIPLCAAASVIKSITGKKTKTTPERVLFIELSEMGSAILADPAMRLARKRFNAELFFLIFAKNKPSLDLLSTIKDENIFTIDASGILPLIKDTMRFLIWARKKKIDTAIDLELFSRYTALLSAFCGAANIVGFHNFHAEGLYRGNMLTHRVLYNPHMHISKNFVAMINSLDEKSDGRPYSKTPVPDSDVVLAKAVISPERVKIVTDIIKSLYQDIRGKRIILINPNASELLPQRRWSMVRYAELIKMILADYNDCIVLITGAKSERDEAEKMALSVADSRCINFAGKLKLSELTALYSVSSLMVSNDSGPAHFASVTDMPTIVIFGPETPELYRSLGDTTPIYAKLACSPCVSAYNHRKTPCTENLCLEYISTDMVFSAVKERLDK